MSKFFVIFVLMFTVLTLSSSISLSADRATDNPTTGVLQVPVALVGPTVYNVEMQRTVG